MTHEHAESKSPGATAPQGKPQTKTEKHDRQRLSAVIGGHVMNTLGRPPDLHSVQVRPLWEDYYRVNIFVGVDAACVKIANSYFLIADSDGNIITSTPGIKKQYPHRGEEGPPLSTPAAAPHGV
jgi:hypothetical protein